jgi:hypothetical protein
MKSNNWKHNWEMAVGESFLADNRPNVTLAGKKYKAKYVCHREGEKFRVWRIK